jgi:hypothetical protein
LSEISSEIHTQLSEEEDLRSDNSGVNAGHTRSACTGTVRCSWLVASWFDAISSLLPELFSYHWQANGDVIVVNMKTALTYDFIKLKFTLEQAMNAQRGSRGITLLFL